MKRYLLVFLIFIVSRNFVFAQMVSVGILPFEIINRAVTPEEAERITNQVIAELGSWGTLNIVRGEAGADYLVRGSLSKQGSFFVLSASTENSGTRQTLNEYSEQASAAGDLSVFSFCLKAVEKVPMTNYLTGIWRSEINMPDGPVVCIIEFNADRTIRVERYDTWEHRQNNTLRYEGYGSGNYSYAGYARRIMTVNSQQIQVDASANISLTLEDTLPGQTAVNKNGLLLVFNSDRNFFEIVNSELPCGQNYDGASVHPSASIGFSRFTRIR